MRLSHLAIVPVLFVASQLLAQHQPGNGSSSSSGSSAGSSSTSSSSSPSPSYSGSSGSSSSSHSSSDHSASSSSSSSSSSGSSSSRGSDSSSSSSSRGSTSRSTNDGGGTSHSRGDNSGPDISRTGRERGGRDNHTTSESGHSPSSTRSDTMSRPERKVSDNKPAIDKKGTTDRVRIEGQADTKREKKGLFSFLRHHGKEKPVDPKLRATEKYTPPKRCKVGETCPVCGVGQHSVNGKCVPDPVAANACPPGEPYGSGRCSPYPASSLCPRGAIWDGIRCVAHSDSCDSAALVAQELRAIQSQMRMACSPDPSTLQCRDLQQKHESALSRYRMYLNAAPPSCRGTLPDPASL